MSTEADKPNTAALATICAVLFISMLGITLSVMALVRTTEQDDVSKKSVSARAPFDELATNQRGELSKGYEWMNRDAGFASVPIDRAMQIVLKNIQSDPESATPPAPPAADAGAEGAATEEATGDAGTTAEGDATTAATEADAGATKPKKGELPDDMGDAVDENVEPKPKTPKAPKGGAKGAQPAPPPPTEPGTGP